MCSASLNISAQTTSGTGKSLLVYGPNYSYYLPTPGCYTNLATSSIPPYGYIRTITTFYCNGYPGSIAIVTQEKYTASNPTPYLCTVQNGTNPQVVRVGNTCGTSTSYFEVKEKTIVPNLPAAAAGEILFTYDALGRLVGRADAINTQQMYGYDAAGNRLYLIKK